MILSKIFNCTTTILGLWRYGGTGTKYFCTFESIGNNISGTLHFFLRYFNADFWGEKIFSLQSYCNLVGFLLFIISVLVLCYNIKNFFKVNIVDQVLVVGICLQTAAFTFSNMFDPFAARYVIIPVLFLLILVCRFDYEMYITKLKTMFADFNLKYKKIKRLLIMFFCLIPISRIPFLPMKQLQDPSYVTLANYLIDKNLTNGFAPYWSSHVVTLASKGKVQVSNVIANGPDIEQSRWLSKSSWYKEPANFVILNNEGLDAECLPKDLVLEVLGEPVEIVDIENYSILIYDYDISKRVNSDYNIYKKGYQLSYNTELSFCENNRLILCPGDIQFGPCTKFNKGLYRVEILGDNLHNGAFDVYSRSVQKANKMI